MSNQPQATANAAEPRLCKMGCGFFGSGATGDCCSKCWHENKKTAESKAVAAVKEAVAMEEEPSPMEIDTPSFAPEVATTASESVPTTQPVTEMEVSKEAAPAAGPTKKKKKAKANYKNMMAGMMKGSPSRDAEKDKEQLRKVTGGGAFSKIDKI